MTIDPAWLQQQFPDISALSPIGRGGQKFVFSGKHTNDGDIVLKICLNMEPERISREITAVKNIQSSRVPTIMETGTAQSPLGEIVWIREQLISGNNLRNALIQGGLSSSTTLRIGLHILEALTSAEQARIVHRDVKPENIILDIDGNAWLLDFGLSRHLDLASLTATANAYGVGTLGYAPPEQFKNKKGEIDSKVDLFALGVTLFECVEGVNPFRDGARDPGEVLHRIETIPLRSISKPVDADGQFKDLVSAMTRIRPAHRIASANEALAWMQEICSREGIV